MAIEGAKALRRGWTTGACAAAAARAAFAALATGRFPDPVSIRLPRGGTAQFGLALAEIREGRCRAGIVKDAGDDPDVTHGALVIAEVAPAPPGTGISFAAGEGVGTVTRAGLALAIGEPAINPGPRAMIRDALFDEADENGLTPPDLTVTISIPDGENLAKKTMNAPAWNRWRPVDPGDDWDRHPLFLFIMDPFDPARDRRRARCRARPHRGHNRGNLRTRRPAALRACPIMR